MTAVSKPRSMTGYGKGEDTTAAGRFTVEIKSVNHRYSEVSVKLPRQFLFAENEIRKSVSARLKRGKIDIFVQFESSAGDNGKPSVNLLLAKAYFDAFKSLRQALGIQDVITIEMIASQKDVLTYSSDESGIDDISGSLFRALESALDVLEMMRRTEGELLVSDISERLDNLRNYRVNLLERAPEAVRQNKEKLEERLSQLLVDSAIDESRIIQEAALLADKSDITEELVRMESHLSQFRETISVSSEPVGRKLDFIIQEMNREVNTVGSKSSDIAISSLVVEMKAEIEKIREQIQNLE